jgi:hypothetical protein
MLVVDAFLGLTFLLVVLGPVANVFTLTREDSLVA